VQFVMSPKSPLCRGCELAFGQEKGHVADFHVRKEAGFDLLIEAELELLLSQQTRGRSKRAITVRPLAADSGQMEPSAGPRRGHTGLVI
jgi:hypothetical protein